LQCVAPYVKNFAIANPCNDSFFARSFTSALTLFDGECRNDVITCSQPFSGQRNPLDVFVNVSNFSQHKRLGLLIGFKLPHLQ